jgi:hypothetical protein
MKKTTMIFKMCSYDEHKITSKFSVLTKGDMINVRGGVGDPKIPFLK